MSDITTRYRQFFDSFFLFLESKYAPYRTVPIHIGSEPKNTTPYILYNTEQLTRRTQLERVLRDIKRTNPKEIWDYSHANCDILKSHNIIARHVPLKSPEWYVEKCKAWRAEGLTHDIGFCGALSERRKAILVALINKGFSVNYINSWGEERDKALAQCNIHLNIHHEEDFQIFESARCDLWLTVGVPIVSEHSLDDDPRCINVPYNKLTDATVDAMRKSNII